MTSRENMCANYLYYLFTYFCEKTKEKLEVLRIVEKGYINNA
jgi:hypothetical protein